MEKVTFEEFIRHCPSEMSVSHALLFWEQYNQVFEEIKIFHELCEACSPKNELALTWDLRRETAWSVLFCRLMINIHFKNLLHEHQGTV